MNIKKTALLLILLLALSLAVISCTDEPQKTEDEYFTVTLDYNNGSAPHTVRVEADKTMPQPKNPEKEGYIFGGWRNGGKEWHFETDMVFNNITLTAAWIDASSVFEYTANEDGTITVTSYSGKLSDIGIPKIISGFTVSALGDGIFDNTDKKDIATITLPDSLTSVGASALEGFSNTPIFFEGKLSHLGESAFSGCNRLFSISLTDEIEKIPFNAFASCSSLSSIEIPSSVTVIEENAFYGCTSLKTIVINSKDVVIENGAFSGCESLVSVFFFGNEEEWLSVLENVDNGGGENEYLLSAKVYFWSENKPESDGNYWYITEDGEARTW